MKAYVIKVTDPEIPNDTNPFCYIYEETDCDDKTQVTLDELLAYQTATDMRERHPYCEYTVIEFDI